jgi:hypothetical protein
MMGSEKRDRFAPSHRFGLTLRAVVRQSDSTVDTPAACALRGR